MKPGLSLMAGLDTILQRPGRILLASDFDGTLCPLIDRPSEAQLIPSVRKAVEKVLACHRVTFAVITGRALTDIERRFPAGAIFAGNHGLEIAGGGLHYEHDSARSLRPAIAEACEALEGASAAWPAAWVEDKGLTATLHFRKVKTAYRETLLFAARRTLGAFGPKIAMRAGRDALEIRPRVAWDKGAALEYIYGEAGPFDACVCLGDDRTDESMFRAPSCDVSVRVGASSVTAAAFCVSEPADVAPLFSHLVSACGAEPQSMKQGFGTRPHSPAIGGSLTADHAGPGQ
ncbi:MAG TPA: trehalose-phosphatase [Bryobacteraceae bacterium]|nr:trehalose-phosphatase [Bryobacteraceae bacterium]